MKWFFLNFIFIFRNIFLKFFLKIFRKMFWIFLFNLSKNALIFFQPQKILPFKYIFLYYLWTTLLHRAQTVQYTRPSVKSFEQLTLCWKLIYYVTMNFDNPNSRHLHINNNTMKAANATCLEVEYRCSGRWTREHLFFLTWKYIRICLWCKENILLVSIVSKYVGLC